MLEKISGHGYCTVETKKETIELTKMVKHIKGALVECGVAQGVQLALFNYADPTKEIWGFDSFVGIPHATHPKETQPAIGKVTPRKTGEHLESTGISAHSQKDVELNFDKWLVDTTKITLVKGWFENTMPDNKVGKISLLRLDGDMYEATRVCLKYLFPKLEKGGILIIDDWGLAGCRIACDEYFGEYKRLKPLKPMNTNQPMNFIKL